MSLLSDNPSLYQNHSFSKSLELPQKTSGRIPSLHKTVIGQTGSGAPVNYNSDTGDELTEVPTDMSQNLLKNSVGSPKGGVPNSSDSGVVSQDSVRKSKRVRRKKTRKAKAATSLDDVNEELNSTTVFQVNSDAKLKADGSLDYTDGFRKLPLTPVSLKKNPDRLLPRPKEVPKLDLGPLTGSYESVSFQPLSSLRSSDTYRTYLGNISEKSLDTEV